MCGSSINRPSSLVGEVSNLAGAKCPMNSKTYHKCGRYAFVFDSEGNVTGYCNDKEEDTVNVGLDSIDRT